MLSHPSSPFSLYEYASSILFYLPLVTEAIYLTLPAVGCRNQHMPRKRTPCMQQVPAACAVHPWRWRWLLLLLPLGPASTRDIPRRSPGDTMQRVGRGRLAGRHDYIPRSKANEHRVANDSVRTSITISSSCRSRRPQQWSRLDTEKKPAARISALASHFRIQHRCLLRARQVEQAAGQDRGQGRKPRGRTRRRGGQGRGYSHPVTGTGTETSGRGREWPELDGPSSCRRRSRRRGGTG
ncbi:hypothetical protein K456DRAFT_180377 [Colletotrichum gloeosporioides 23]|nr:hypothetical protein K456DRAFT_180377 [Colletotrichum gloeosporioides 23]